MRIAFIHPDLGIGTSTSAIVIFLEFTNSWCNILGGAERLVVDAGVGLQERGHSVEFFTSHHDRAHCFDETKNGMWATILHDSVPGTLKVTIYGDIHRPKWIVGFAIVFAIIRNLILCSRVVIHQLYATKKINVIFVDQLSVGIPILKLTGAKVWLPDTTVTL